MTTNPQAVDPTEHHEGHLEELEQLKAIWAKHGTVILIGAIVIAVVIGGARMVNGWRAGKEASAQAALTAGRTIEDFENIVKHFGSTAAAPVARLTLGKTRYDLGQYQQAMQEYEAFLANHPKHPMARTAALGLIACRELTGDPSAAADEYRAFADADPKHFLAPQALIGQARCLEQAGRLEEARIAYEDIIATRAGTAWSGRASEALASMDQRRRATDTMVIPSPQPLSTPMAQPELVIPEAAAPQPVSEPMAMPEPVAPETPVTQE